MPNFEFTSPEGKKYTVAGPDGSTKEQAFQMLQKQISAKPGEAKKETPSSSMMSDIGQGIGNFAAGALRGAGSIGATLLAPVDAAARAMGIQNSVIGRTDRRQAMDEGLANMGAQPDSLAYKGGQIGAEIAGTAGVGGALAGGMRAIAPSLVRAGASAPVMQGIGNALATGGMRAGAVPGAGNMLMRVAGGAATGGASAGLVNPEYAGSGAIIGGALPPAMIAAGKIGGAIGRTISGPGVSPELRQSVDAARQAGYVIPPTQANPTLVNRALEGISGKISTAQNASARNQPITNELAKKAIGASELSESGLAQVRSRANSAYDAIAKSAPFQADSAFTSALDAAGASTNALRRNFPELVNNEVDDLISGLKSRGQFEAQPTIEAIKQFRASASGNKISTDPAKKALGQAQSKIAGALEDMIDRNLQSSGNTGLLDSYRSARQTLAKTYDVEKALNKASGNVDANKLAQALKKGRPLTDELRTIAEFGAQFPKANQTLERIGSLPQFSPLDFGGAGILSAATANPMMMASVLARPGARAMALSPMVQNRLATQPSNALQRMLSNEEANQLIYRSAPVIGSN